MARAQLNLSTPNDGAGDPLRDGGARVNANAVLNDQLQALTGYPDATTTLGANQGLAALGGSTVRQPTDTIRDMIDRLDLRSTAAADNSLSEVDQVIPATGRFVDVTAASSGSPFLIADNANPSFATTAIQSYPGVMGIGTNDALLAMNATGFNFLGENAAWRFGATPGPGTAGQIPVSQGPGLAPEWETPAASSDLGANDLTMLATDTVRDFGMSATQRLDMGYLGTNPLLDAVRQTIDKSGGQVIQVATDGANGAALTTTYTSGASTNAGIRMQFIGNGSLSLNLDEGTAGQAFLSTGPGSAPVWGDVGVVSSLTNLDSGFAGNAQTASGYEKTSQAPVPAAGWGTRVVYYTEDVAAGDGTGTFDHAAFLPGVNIGPFTGASAATAGTQGGVAAPAAGQEGYSLMGDNTWAQIRGKSITKAASDYVAGATDSVLTITGAEHGLGSDITVAVYDSTAGTRRAFEPDRLETFASGDIQIQVPVGDEVQIDVAIVPLIAA